MAPHAPMPRPVSLRRRLQRQLLPLLASLTLAFLGAAAWSVRRAAEDALAAARRQETRSWARAEHRPEGPGERQVRRFLPELDVLSLGDDGDGRLLLGTSGGAQRLDPLTGRPESLPVPRGVRSSAVRAAARLGDGLALGLEDGGVAWLRGRRTLLVPPDPDAGRVRALAPYAGGLAVGTAQGRVWWVSGAGGSRPGLPGEAGVPGAARVVVGRAGELLLAGAAGELVWVRGGARHRDRISGETPLAAALGDGVAWVGTELGLWRWEPGEPPRRHPVGALVRSLAADAGGVWLGAGDGRVLRLETSGGPGVVEARLPGPVRALRVRPEGVYAGGAFGLVRLEPGRGVVSRWEPSGLHAPHVTALAPGPAGRLWVGSFAGGLALLDPGSGRVERRHTGVDQWQVNDLEAADPGREAASGLLVATSRGLFTEEPSGDFRRLDMGEPVAGGASPRYQALLPHGGALLVAGKDGVRWRRPDGRVQAIGSFHGLPSNKAYALAGHGDAVYVGTLGGLARLDGGRLARTWRPESSALPAGWVQALGVASTGLFLGTFGGGVAWLPEGELEVRPVPGTPPDVSPGALLVHGRRVLVGTADQGVAVLDTRGTMRGLLQAGLPSLEVGALAADEEGLWVGTSRGLARVEWSALGRLLR